MRIVIRISIVALLAAACCVGASAHSLFARLHVVQVVAKGSPIPVEGAVPYLRVVRPDGTRVVQRRLSFTRTPSATLRLRRGRFRLLSWQRYCDGNCERLDPPTDRCSRRFVLRRGQLLRAVVTVRYGSGCRIAFR